MTCCLTRTRCQGVSNPMRYTYALARTTRAAGRAVRAAGVVTLAAVWLAGCSDDVVCPDDVPPFISAQVIEVSDGRVGSTFVEVYCSGDPLPDILAVAINDRQLPDVVPANDRPGFVTTLSETTIVWQPGTNCVLSVANEYGIASSLGTVPGPFEVAAPGTASAGGVAVITWMESDDADYYLLEATIASAFAETTEIAAVVEGTSFDVDLPLTSGSGVLSGSVSAVSGPLPEAGSVGNVSGEGWGFMNISYRNSASLFHVVVAAAPLPTRPTEVSASKHRPPGGDPLP